VASKLTRQVFFQTARRRAIEAQILLDAPRDWILPGGSKLLGHTFDAAVVCGLLAAECALKATLLHGHAADHIDALPDAIRQDVFDSSEGHKIKVLWDRQHARVKDGVAADVVESIQKLSLPDRYDLRYGGRRPKRSEAEPFVKHTDVIIEWMKQRFA
jgi:hypothetical protein